MTSQEIRQQFLDFFKSKDHTFVPSSPVVPLDDPTLLFTNAGMNQFKDIFLEKGTRKYKRAANSQKCIRVSGKHNDLEEVGHDTYHHTFFEMLGNWSFGDYYKKEAIQWAWELFTEIWKLPKDKLYATVYKTDDEAEQLWKQVTDINPNHVLKFDEKDNFWEMGATGPCGPCSEIHIDLGPKFCNGKHKDGTECFVNGGCPRYIELWNLVFIQYNRDENGDLHPLPKKHVDTGAGFERILSVLQNKTSNYDTDVFVPIIEHIARICGQDYNQSKEQVAYRVIADHVRMLTFSIADGGLPSNDGRGYVMRRILRRAARYGRKLNMHEPFIYKLVTTVVNVMGNAYPELIDRAEHVTAVIRAEEEHFNRTLDRGLEIFDKIKTTLRDKKKKVIAGEDVFRLYDTYGFPVDLTRILAEENGLTLDILEFEKLMEKQRERARAASKFGSQSLDSDNWIIMNEGDDSSFVGYEELAIETYIMRYHVDDKKIRIVLKDTPFYAESGGQVGDRGTLILDDIQLEVVDTQKDGDHIIHICNKMADFNPRTDKVLAEVVSFERQDTQKNHTATHLLHAALKSVLGNHVNQAGSLVESDRLRFDFTHFEKISAKELREIETIVNHKIQQNIPLEIAHEKYTEAREKGAMALFGEKYGDIVRTVQVPGFSLELCGGTHVRATGEIGIFVITSESGIASGVRRIEAITGTRAVEYALNAHDTLLSLNELLNSQSDQLIKKVKILQEEKRKLEKEIAKSASSKLTSDINSILAQTEMINGITTLTYKTENVQANQLKELSDQIRDKVKSIAALLLSQTDDKINFVCMVTDDLVEDKQLNAGNIVREVAKVAGGGGGGRPNFATAGGKDISKIDASIEKFKEVLKKF
ncbi:MAG: alanine--tRNA ligase [Calditrichaceae bacterium]|nr:alanine--tRNA ligase [Calditrichaceae bacterium]